MRNISFSMTTQQYEDGDKDVTRRMGWEDLEPGDVLMAVEKGMGLKKGEKIRKLGHLRVISARREPLDAIIHTPAYGVEECRREGFPDMTPAEFVAFFCKGHKGCTPDTIVTRIEFEKLED